MVGGDCHPALSNCKSPHDQISSYLRSDQGKASFYALTTRLGRSAGCHQLRQFGSNGSSCCSFSIQKNVGISHSFIHTLFLFCFIWISEPIVPFLMCSEIVFCMVLKETQHCWVSLHQMNLKRLSGGTREQEQTKMFVLSVFFSIKSGGKKAWWNVPWIFECFSVVPGFYISAHPRVTV